MTVNEGAPSASVQAVGVAFSVLEALSQTPGAIGTSELPMRNQYQAWLRFMTAEA